MSVTTGSVRRIIRANRLLEELGHPGDTLAALEELAALRKDAAGLREVLGEMVAMMDSGDEHGAGSEWHTKARAAMAKTKPAPLGAPIAPEHADELNALSEAAVEFQRQAMLDVKRLDYIASNARCDPKIDGNHVWWPTSFNHRLTGATLRAAIDAAMAEKVQP